MSSKIIKLVNQDKLMGEEISMTKVKQLAPLGKWKLKVIYFDGKTFKFEPLGFANCQPILFTNKPKTRNNFELLIQMSNCLDDFSNALGFEFEGLIGEARNPKYRNLEKIIPIRNKKQS